MQKEIVLKADNHLDYVMPSYTHLQRAQPILLSHQLMAYYEMLQRDKSRLNNCYEIADELILGSGAVAGSFYKLDRNFLAKELGFKKINSNSIDGVSDRDFIIEFLSSISISMMHLSRISEELIIWCSEEFDFIKLSDDVVTTSSMMPQKRNPISSEVILACSKLLREHHSAMLDSMVLDHERATGQWHLEWYTLPKMFIIASSSFRCSRELLEGIQVDKNKMINNLNQTNGLILAESVMMTIAPKLGRQIAHDLVYDCCRKSITDKISLLEALMMDKNISKNFRREEIEFCLNPKNYLGAAPRMAEELLKNIK